MVVLTCCVFVVTYALIATERVGWAFALGADLGGNTTAVAVGANVVVVGLAARHHEPISFWQFTRYGLPVTAVTLLLAWPYVWLRYFHAS